MISIDNPNVPVVEGVTPDQFRDEIVPGNRPVLLKGIVTDWPAVRAARESTEAIAEYIRQHDRGATVETIIGRPEIEGRFFYNDDLSGLNFAKIDETIANTVRRLLASRDEAQPPAAYIQSLPIRDCLRGFEQENQLALLPADVSPRIWIGNRLTVQTHFDLRDNIACLVAGRRRFTLFPPEQTPNLYPGPFELTLSGPPVSMVQLREPDLERYPRFAVAQEHMQVAELEPGDALYVPYFWWHNVESLDDFNVLVNYWWNDADARLGSPFDAMLHGLLAIRDLPANQRSAWKTMFETYVFHEHGEPVAHLPEQTHGPLGRHDEALRQHIRILLLQSLARQAGVTLPRGD